MLLVFGHDLPGGLFNFTHLGQTCQSNFAGLSVINSVIVWLQFVVVVKMHSILNTGTLFLSEHDLLNSSYSSLFSNKSQ